MEKLKELAQYADALMRRENGMFITLYVQHDGVRVNVRKAGKWKDFNQIFGWVELNAVPVNVFKPIIDYLVAQVNHGN